MPEILYDITMLGACASDLHKQTGVFRVIDNLTRRLVASDFAGRLDFYANNLLPEAARYVATYPVYDGRSIFTDPETYLMWLSTDIRAKENELSDKIAKNTSKTHQRAYKAHRLLLYSLRRRLLPLAVSFIRKLPVRARLYHSPFLPIPEQYLQAKHLKRCLTIYDLIPILHPEYFISQPVPVQQAIDAMRPHDYFFVISHSTKRDLCRYRPDIDPNRVFVTHLAADSDVFYPVTDEIHIRTIGEKYSIPNAPYFLSLSTLEPRKNIEMVIRSFARLKQQQFAGNANLVLVGKKGWDFETIFSTLEKYDFIRSQVIFTGYVPDTDLAALYSGSMSFIYVSHYEGFGLPPLEAMQCGVPTITSDNSSLPEVVGDAAIMINSKDEAGLCQAMLELYNDPVLRAEMSRRSLAQAARFSWENTASQTIQGYKIALAL